jgi:hypothetical protein
VGFVGGWLGALIVLSVFFIVDILIRTTTTVGHRAFLILAAGCIGCGAGLGLGPFLLRSVASSHWAFDPYMSLLGILLFGVGLLLGAVWHLGLFVETPQDPEQGLDAGAEANPDSR